MADVKTCVVDLNNGRLKLDCRLGMTVFAGLRMHNIFLPTGCGAKGLCGQCRLRMTAGAEQANPPTEFELNLLSDADRAAGWRLGCQLRLQGDMSLEVSEPVFHAKKYAATVASITPLTHDINRYSFTLPEGDTVPHVAGQFFNLMVKIPDSKAMPIRCFSFATPSSVVDCIDAIIRLNPKGIMTPYLFNQLKVGDEVTIYAPFGEFHLRDTGAPCIWIAGGSGLSPFLGMLKDMIDKGVTSRQVHLFFGAVKPGDLYYVDLLHELAATHDWFTYTPALSGDERTDVCRDYGLITDVVAHYVQDASCCEGYLCGSPGMIGACIKVLSERGMDRNNIFFDRFN